MQPNKEYTDFALFNQSLEHMRLALTQAPRSLIAKLLRKDTDLDMFVFELFEEEMQSAFAGEEDLLYATAWSGFNDYLARRVPK